mmetsp:Transcript_138708/g.386805  ORF Transcript_138708/g.386805 Transcript_138708/m.386805 type:complete len:213 (-) Transcript_138708:48-686(-)
MGTTKYLDNLKTSVTIGSNWVWVLMPCVMFCFTKMSWIFCRVSCDSASGRCRFGHQKRGMTLEPRASMDVPTPRASASAGLAGTSGSSLGTAWATSCAAVGIAAGVGRCGELAVPELAAPPHSLMGARPPSGRPSRRMPRECGLPGGEGLPEGVPRSAWKLGLGTGASARELSLFANWTACRTIFCDSGRDNHSQKNSSSFDFTKSETMAPG